MQVFKRICSTIEAMEVHYEQEVLCTVSMGLLEVGKHDADAEDVFKRADKAFVLGKQEETEFTLPTKPYLKTQHKVLKKITSLINIIAVKFN